VEVIRSLHCPVVIGNHDYYAAFRPRYADLNAMAVAGIEYSIERLSAEDRDWLAKLPTVHIADDTTFVHASLEDPLEWNYVLGPRDAQDSMSRQETHVGFCGHTHQPGIFTNPGSAPPTNLGRGKMRLNPEGKYLINPGSVGQPRSGDPRAQFAIFDPQTRTVEFVKVRYDVEVVVDAVLAAGLPEMLGERLRFGM
jgi:diadenosine tetraphosphatase ApaH/serine/threonine PP2A family protein phosphatase